MITTEQRDEAMEYLSETDEAYAKARAYQVGIEDQKGTVLSDEFLQSKLKTVDAKKADSQTSRQYFEWRKKHRNAVYDYEILKNKRLHAALLIDLWRSEFAARRQGMIV